MDDTLCGKIDLLRKYLPDNSDNLRILDFYDNDNFQEYCPEKNCNSELEQITIGFLWLLGECYSTLTGRVYNENNTNAFFIYIISWLSYKLNQNKEENFATINDFFTEYVKKSGKYERFISDAFKIGELKKFMDERNDFMNINIEDLSKFYDVFKLLCNIHNNVAQNKPSDTLSNSATSFVNELTELNNNSKIEGTVRSKILPVLSTDYDNLKNICTRKGINCKDFPSLPEIVTNVSALKSGYTSSSSIGNKLFTVLSIFGAIAFFLGISYKYSLFGFRKRAQKQYLKEKIKNIKKKMNR
ncbi:PIR protein [Plasmodium yoelii]|uniref:PIR protein n=2 Tax=Plasmodium yoelii TaxID=5861 RepID=A0AAF0AZD7_PLAYO|nr:PIR protein [Plasmodium yoelii]WBY56502.1 PIR protein [Plasmodium yoelii yoelii]CDS44034.1 YIR protein [Plasmodium yoelii]VTZ77006.1 PIR protein [Plasmodium yoelii]|eukprot:XP_034493461.1 PIR protein [Plasmodium yoelii]